MAGIKEKVWDNLKGGIVIGGEEFAEEMRDILENKSSVREIPKAERFALRPALSDIFQRVGTREERNCFIYNAHIKYGYGQKEIGDHLGIHYSTVSRVVKELIQLHKGLGEIDNSNSKT
jgi:DNA-directed RNA polymerase specialized sigma subunit